MQFASLKPDNHQQILRLHSAAIQLVRRRGSSRKDDSTSNASVENQQTPPPTTSTTIPATNASPSIDNFSAIAPSTTSLDTSHLGYVLHEHSPAKSLLDHSSIGIQRKVEMMSIFMNVEQSRTFAIHATDGQPIGSIQEEESGWSSNFVTRQLFRLRRNFRAKVFDISGQHVLTLHRPFYWWMSKMYLYSPEGQLIGGVAAEWNLLRRKYDLFHLGQQFSKVDAPPLSWTFDAINENGAILARVDKDFTGFARELFTDANQYALHLDPDPRDDNPVLYYDHRALLLALAITVDFDYFSRHQSSGMMPWYMIAAGGQGD